MRRQFKQPFSLDYVLAPEVVSSFLRLILLSLCRRQMNVISVTFLDRMDNAR